MNTRKRSTVDYVTPKLKETLSLRSVAKLDKIAAHEKRRDKGNRVIELLGRGLRSVVNTIDVDSALPTTDREINRRAGKTAGALALTGALALGTLFIGSSSIETDPDGCINVEQSQFGDTPAEAASKLSFILGSSSDVYDQALETFIVGKPYSVCKLSAQKNLGE